MKKNITTVACVLMFGLVNSFDLLESHFPPLGPKSGEKGKYIYTVNGVDYRLCQYCPEDAFKSTYYNELMQEPLCIAKYDDIANEITSYERENDMTPVCKVGLTPGCGPPPEEYKTTDNDWFCDPGYSNVTYSVYSSCVLIHKQTKKVTWAYYCNESLLWLKDSTVSADLFAVTATQKDDITSFKIVVIAGGSFMAILVGLLVAVTVYMCQNKRQNDRLVQSDIEARVNLMTVRQAISSQPKYQAGKDFLKSTTDSEYGSDNRAVTHTDQQDNNEMKNGRVPPYGAEGPTHTSGGMGSSHTTGSLQNTFGGQSYSACASGNSTQSYRGDGSGTEKSKDFGENTTVTQPLLHSVRAELSASTAGSFQTRQLSQSPEHLPQSPASMRNVSSHSLLEMKPFDRHRVSRNFNNLNGRHGVETERPTPQGNISMNMVTEPNPHRNTSIIYSESVSFDDENDKGHNTTPKQIVTESARREPEVSSCEHMCHCHSKRFSVERDASHCMPELTSQSSSFEIDIENVTTQPFTDDHHDSLEADESFEIQSHQLIPH